MSGDDVIPARSGSAVRWTSGELPQATIAKLAVGPMSNNSYLVRCRATGAALLIDAANEANRLVEFARFGGEPAGTVLTTHQHADHWQALAELVGTDRRQHAGRGQRRGRHPGTDRAAVAARRPVSRSASWS